MAKTSSEIIKKLPENTIQSIKHLGLFSFAFIKAVDSIAVSTGAGVFILAGIPITAVDAMSSKERNIKDSYNNYNEKIIQNALLCRAVGYSTLAVSALASTQIDLSTL